MTSCWSDLLEPNTAMRHSNNEAVEPSVGDHQVAAATEHEHRGAYRIGVRNRFDEIGRVVGPHEVRGRTTEVDRGVVGQQQRMAGRGIRGVEHPRTLRPATCLDAHTYAADGSKSLTSIGSGSGVETGVRGISSAATPPNATIRAPNLTAGTTPSVNACALW